MPKPKSHKTMKTHSFLPTGALLAGAAAFSLITAIAARANADTHEAAEAAQISALTGMPDNPRVTDALGDLFAEFAGSEDNAQALVTGLHDGTAIDLTTTVDGQTTTSTITPPAGKLGYGNVFLSLALAQEELTKLGITQPTSAQIQAALNGGSVTTGTGGTAVTTQLSGVLVLRNQGMDWKQIAQSLNVNLRSAIRDSRSNGALIIDRLGDRFEAFAGSEENGEALVTGLHDGTAVTITTTVNGATTTATFTPATGKLGFGGVSVALALAQEELTKLGVTQPTADQIVAALNGGSVTTGTGDTAVTTQLNGVLVLRNQGQGWGQIAQTLGVNLGSAIRDARTGELVDHVGDRFTTFVGSEENADALVTGLHDGTAVTLTTTVDGQTSTVTITPAASKLGLRSVSVSLALAQEELTKLGITQPTLAQIQAALDGGSVTTGAGATAVTTQLSGVLVLRDQGMTWRQVAQSLGVDPVRPGLDGNMQFAGGHLGGKLAWHDHSEGPEQAGSVTAASRATSAAADTMTPSVTRPESAISSHPDRADFDRSARGTVARPAVGTVTRPEAAVSARPAVPAVVRPVSVEHFVRPDIPVRPATPRHY
jgi:transcriptional regulator